MSVELAAKLGTWLQQVIGILGQELHHTAELRLSFRSLTQAPMPNRQPYDLSPPQGYSIRAASLEAARNPDSLRARTLRNVSLAAATLIEHAILPHLNVSPKLAATCYAHRERLDDVVGV
ncbi:hypothetical protein COCCADRAFT_34859 [Bipolaris zeicola 26-R-13]|uniref:Uncharacterized protein n=1 Tax=Cochliobolus carbonum (strain 26-R-13) TaxID=930089 RepID=W6Y7L5_COCC2|nr:uncharacterized protein COCCADRAFT_34859 [Bipolaris zeicola 26-R-13]EUC35612.1 hypothetical protein COCCADRAFT_34859 [Bipolaris zeicola 26-R-13]